MESTSAYDIKFNEAGLISEVTQYWGGKFHQKTIKEYDKAGKLITEYVEVPDRSYIEHSKYDSDGLLIEKTKPSCKQIYRYDKQGKLIQLFKHIKALDNFCIDFLYNEEGYIVKHIKKYSNNLFGEIVTYSYDKKGNIDHSIFNEDGNDIFIHFEYDQDGEITKTVEVSSHIKSDSEEPQIEIPMVWYEDFEYDENGNIIASITRNGNRIDSRKEWKIKYRDNNKQIKTSQT